MSTSTPGSTDPVVVPADPPGASGDRAKRYGGLFGWLHRMKDWVEGLAARRHAGTALFLIAFIESIFFPIPADVLLMALCVGRPRRAFVFAAICTLGSVLGAGIGYAIGYGLWYAPTAEGGAAFTDLARFFFDRVPGFTEPTFERVGALYREYDFWAIFIAGFTPLPYKVFTITAGVFQLSLPMFFLASVLSRSARFFLVSALFYFFGAAIKGFIDRYLEVLSVLFVVLLIGGFVLLKYIL